jgi:hypothetical protein
VLAIITIKVSFRLMEMSCNRNIIRFYAKYRNRLREIRVGLALSAVCLAPLKRIPFLLRDESERGAGKEGDQERAGRTARFSNLELIFNRALRAAGSLIWKRIL